MQLQALLDDVRQLPEREWQEHHTNAPHAVWTTALLVPFAHPAEPSVPHAERAWNP